jgi:DNA polymerase-3 subunit delta'
MQMVYRDIMLLKTKQKENMLINYDKKDIILSNADAFTVQKLIRNIELVEQTYRNLKYNANFQLSIEAMLMKLQED